MRIVVVGSGFGGMAASARLAKLGHQVALVEAAAELGGALAPVRSEGFTWDAGPGYLTLPAVLRDLFRKTGRPLEDEPGELVPLPVVREHRFPDQTTITLPGGSRAAQTVAWDDVGAGLGERWQAYVDPLADVWDVVRRHHAEEVTDPEPAELTALLDGRETLYKRLRRAFKDDRLAQVAAHPFVAEGHDLRNVPVWAGVVSYLEQCFGLWRPTGGMRALRDLLEARLAERSVTVLREAPVRDLVVRPDPGGGRRVVAVRTGIGEIEADAVVVAIDPRRLPTLAPLVERSMPALPPVVTHVALEGEVPDLPHEVVLAGDPLLVVRTTPAGEGGPAGTTTWTVHGRGRLEEDLLTSLARRKIDVREQVVARVDLSPRDLVQDWSGSPLGVVWAGRRTVRDRLGPTTPVAGVYACGAHATPGTGGAGIPFVGLSAALVAQAIGPA